MAAVVASEEGWADRRNNKKQKQTAEEDHGVNPLNPDFSEYDPKQRQFSYTRFFFNPNLDLDVESPVGPMRHTDRIFREGFLLSIFLNVVSVKIVSSDYGYPLTVFGTVLARDSYDRKCIYMFRRGKDDCQFIHSKVTHLLIGTSEHVNNMFVGRYNIYAILWDSKSKYPI